MICEHKRESRFSLRQPQPRPRCQIPERGRGVQNLRLYLLRTVALGYTGQTISRAAVDKCGVFAAALFRSRLGLGTVPSLRTASCPFFNCVYRDFTARCAFDSRSASETERNTLGQPLPLPLTLSLPQLSNETEDGNCFLCPE